MVHIGFRFRNRFDGLIFVSPHRHLRNIDIIQDMAIMPRSFLLCQLASRRVSNRGCRRNAEDVHRY